jgi:hypothetical protein
VTAPACPHPHKVKHATRGAALAHIRSLYAAGKGNPDMTPYLCVCGWWHVGHDLESFRRRIRRATRAGNQVARRRKRRR